MTKRLVLLLLFVAAGWACDSADIDEQLRDDCRNYCQMYKSCDAAITEDILESCLDLCDEAAEKNATLAISERLVADCKDRKCPKDCVEPDCDEDFLECVVRVTKEEAAAK